VKQWYFVWILFFVHSALGQVSGEKIRSIPFISEAIHIDGFVTDQEWSAIDTLPIYSHWPDFSVTPNTRTLFRIAYDESYLYFSAVCYGDPGLIQAPTFERDKLGMTMDHVAIILDPYNDNENGVLFAVTTTGSRIDLSINNDAQGEEPIDLSWNSFWEAKVIVNDEGWMAEMRIPFSSLRFQETDGISQMGMILYRYVPHGRQMDIYPEIPPDWGFWSFLKPSQAQDVTFEGIKNKRPWITSPYVLSKWGHHHVPEGMGHPARIVDRHLDAGLAIQHAITNNMNMDITVNTDFAQVEADDQVINLSRFYLFFPEKRRFFLERSSIMEFGFENSNRLFYSRRIGINNGEIIPLWGGVRLVGRIGNYDVGLLTMQSREMELFASENFGVLRLRKRISDNNSYIGGIATSRTDFQGNVNLAYGVDGIINLFGNDYLKINLAQSRSAQDTLVDGNEIKGNRNRIYIQWQNRSQVGFNYSFSYSQADIHYNPGLGFEERVNFKAFGDRISYGWFTERNPSLRFVKLELKANAWITNTTNRLESLMIAPELYVEWYRRNLLRISLMRYDDRPPMEFHLSPDVLIEPGNYLNNIGEITYATPPVNFLASEFTVAGGSYYGGELITASVFPTFILSKFLTLSGFYQYNQINFEDIPDYRSHVGRFKVSTSLSVKYSLNAFVQYNSVSQLSFLNIRFRYNPKDGNDLYLVYNETLNIKGRNDQLLPFSDFRVFILKYVHTLHLGK
jgi:hypothetical protein